MGHDDTASAKPPPQRRRIEGFAQGSGIRLLTTGGRDFTDGDTVFYVLDRVHRKRGVALLIHGAARGADSLAGEWAVARGVPVEAYPAKWRRPDGSLDRSAGSIRNQRMLDEGKPNGCVAFPGGRGTADMVRRCRDAGVMVWDMAHG